MRFDIFSGAFFETNIKKPAGQNRTSLTEWQMQKEVSKFQAKTNQREEPQKQHG